MQHEYKVRINFRIRKWLRYNALLSPPPIFPEICQNPNLTLSDRKFWWGKNFYQKLTHAGHLNVL